MICPNCNEKNLDGSSKCKKCGKAFIDEKNILKKQEENKEEKPQITISCHKCGKDITGDAKVCPSCGYPVSESLRLYSKKNRTMLFSVILVIVCIFLIIYILDLGASANSDLERLLLGIIIPFVIPFVIGFFVSINLISWDSYSKDVKYSNSIFQNNSSLNNQTKALIPKNTYKNQKEKSLHCYHCKETVSSHKDLCKNCGFPIIYSIKLAKGSDIALILSFIALAGFILLFINYLLPYYDNDLVLYISYILYNCIPIIIILVIVFWSDYFSERKKALILYKKLKMDSQNSKTQNK